MTDSIVRYHRGCYVVEFGYIKGARSAYLENLNKA